MGPLQRFLVGGILGAVICGGLAFAAGFLGPMFLAPAANQGPMLGFFAAFAGILIGAVVGFFAMIGRSKETGFAVGSLIGLALSVALAYSVEFKEAAMQSKLMLIIPGAAITATTAVLTRLIIRRIDRMSD